MHTLCLPRLDAIGDAEGLAFQRDGYLIVENLLPSDVVAALRDRFPRIFAGKFDTGIYPDEWYWRDGMSLPDVTRHMANAWKADLTIARLVLSPDIAHAAARLAGWAGTRLGQDTIWWKPPRTRPIAHHQDSSFLDFLDPPQSVTCWVTLDDTRRNAGTLEYVPGSHRWPLTPLPDAFHGEDDYRAQMRRAAEAAGVAPAEPILIEVPAGSCVFHTGAIWHGSGPNTTDDVMRRAIGIHVIPEGARFSDRAGGYIYRRYQRTGETEMDESFFPVLWSESGHRTSWIEGYCATGRRDTDDVASRRAFR